MLGLEMILGHLVGDYIIQNDWMASNKANPGAGLHPGYARDVDGRHIISEDGKWVYQPWTPVDEQGWRAKKSKCLVGYIACCVHCTLYTLSVWAFTFQWMPWWGLLTCWLCHFPIDRYGLARRWMTRVSGQAAFASNGHPCWPWSVIVVDNTSHLLTLWAIAKASGL